MPNPKSVDSIVIRDLDSHDDMRQVEALEKEIWGLSDADVLPLTITVATKEAGAIWIGAFDGSRLIGFAFGFLGHANGQINIHSHMLAVHKDYQDSSLGYKLKLAQRDRALGIKIRNSHGSETHVREMTWTFDPLQSRNAHLNFSKLGVVCDRYEADFYGPATSSLLHQNGTDRLWVRWPMDSRRVRQRLEGKQTRAEVLDALSTVAPLVRFNGDSKPVTGDLWAALGRQRIAIEIPGDIIAVEQKDPALAKQWREATRWAFQEALGEGFLVAEFCRAVRGQQGPGVYLLEKSTAAEFVPEMQRV